ncbi:MAG: hypothetical protein V3U28_02140, partial [Candidatus Acidoferrales bacterium]
MKRTFPIVLVVVLTLFENPARSVSPRDHVGVTDILRKALAEASQIDDESNRSFALIIIAGLQVQADNLVGAYETVGLIRDVSDKGMAWYIISVNLAEKGLFQESFTTADSIPEEDERDRCLKDMALMAAKQGDFAAALNVVSRIRSSYYRALALSELAVVQTKGKKKDSARSLFEAAFEMANTISPHDRRAWVVMQIAVAQAVAGDTSQGFETLRQLRQAIMDQRLKKSFLIDLVGAQAEAGDMEGAYETIDMLEDQVLKDNALAKVAGVQIAAGNITGAINTMSTVEMDSIKVSLLTRIATEQARKGNIIEALANAEAIDYQPYKEIALAEIAGAYAQQGQIEAALETASRISDKDSRVNALIKIATAPGRNGK